MGHVTPVSDPHSASLLLISWRVKTTNNITANSNTKQQYKTATEQQYANSNTKQQLDTVIIPYLTVSLIVPDVTVSVKVPINNGNYNNNTTIKKYAIMTKSA